MTKVTWICGECGFLNRNSNSLSCKDCGVLDVNRNKEEDQKRTGEK